MNVGIVSYGYYVPRLRVKTADIAVAWNKEKDVGEALGVKEKAVGAWDEDSCTFAVEAARMAVQCSGINSQEIGAIYVGSESKPYAVKPSATIVAEAISATPTLTAADLEFACKAGTAAMQMCMGMAESGMIKYGLAIGSDTAQAQPGDALEFTAGGGAAAVLIAKDSGGKANLIATLNDTYSFTTDTPDFWRRQHAEFPSHAGRFTGEPAYFKHVIGAVKGIFEKTGSTPKDYDYVVFHQPNGKFPTRVAKMLGFSDASVKQGLITPFIGNTYSGSSMIGLASVLDVAKPGQKILMCSYGSGSGSDAFTLTVEKGIEKPGKRPSESVLDYINRNKEYTSYVGYIRNRNKIKHLE
ncbi:MAG: hydroxymethylglutaryl-CoA synthase [Candidatus Micrarchaeota archaeon]|nr:hydroxymethylglutaryl-CoA synthase [Candidatus Micrarchaeota archaeon]